MKQYFADFWIVYRSKHFYDTKSTSIYLLFLLCCMLLGFGLGVKGWNASTWQYWVISTPMIISFSFVETYYQKQYRDELDSLGDNPDK